MPKCRLHPFLCVQHVLCAFNQFIDVDGAPIVCVRTELQTE